MKLIRPIKVDDSKLVSTSVASDDLPSADRSPTRTATVPNDPTGAFGVKMTFGYWRDFRIDVAFPTMNYCPLEIEGLT